MKTVSLIPLFLSAVLTGIQGRAMPPEARTNTSLTLSTRVGTTLNNMIELADGANVTVNWKNTGYVMCKANPFVGETLHYWDYRIEFEGPPGIGTNQTADQIFTVGTDNFMPTGFLVFRLFDPDLVGAYKCNLVFVHYPSSNTTLLASTNFNLKFNRTLAVAANGK